MQAEDWGAVIPLILIAVVFWLLILRPARRRHKDAAALQRSLGVGDEVMLTSGVFGTVTGLSDDSFEIEVATGVVLTVHRQAVAKVVTPADRPDEPDRGHPGSEYGEPQPRSGKEQGQVGGPSPADDGGDARR